jgi:hypothetical protein
MRVSTLLVFGIVTALPLRAQAPTANRSADSAFARGDWNAAITGYQALVKRDTVSPAPWFRLGVAHHSLGHYKEAVDAFRNASRRGAVPLSTELRLARSYAKLGDAANAYVRLDSVVKVANPGMLPSAVSDEPDFAALKAESRFKAIVASLVAIRYPCHTRPESQQLNFWVGDWNVAPWSAPPGTPNNVAGTNLVTPILENCVLLENWKGAGGGEGKSMNFFEPSTRKWRQIWVADGGSTLDYAGEFKDGAMRFEGKTMIPNGYILQRLTFTPFGKDTVRQTFHNSLDSGRTWNVTFDARYVRK